MTHSLCAAAASRPRLLASAALGAVMMLGLAGCANGKGTSYTPAEKEMMATMTPQLYSPRTAQEREAVETQDLFAQAAFWSREYDLNPGDVEAAIKLSSALRRMGNPAQALEISRQARAMFPRNGELVAEYAGALIAMERGREAVAPLSQITRTNPNNPRLWSLLGAAHDQMEQFTKAREFYGRALAIAPNDSNILANLGLSFALEGNAPTAEVWLRRAAMDPNASAHVRQNLALVLGLQGKYAEAEALARQDLDPDGAENNLAYLRGLKGRDRSYEAVSQNEPFQNAAPQTPQTQTRPIQPQTMRRQTMSQQPRSAPRTYGQTQPAPRSAPVPAQNPMQRRMPMPAQAQMQPQAPQQQYRSASEAAMAAAQRIEARKAAGQGTRTVASPLQANGYTQEQQAVLDQIAQSLAPGRRITAPTQTQFVPDASAHPQSVQTQQPQTPQANIRRTYPQPGPSAAYAAPQQQQATGYPQQRRAPLRRRE